MKINKYFRKSIVNLLFILSLMVPSMALLAQNAATNIRSHSPQKDSHYVNNEEVKWEYICVTPNGTGNGSSWQSPSSLTEALRWAYYMEKNSPDFFSAYGSLKIFIKEGTYKPQYTSKSTESGTNKHVLEWDSDTKDATFLMVNNVELYGGFSGFESDFESRTGSLTRTILSGDHSSNDSRYDFSMTHDQIKSELAKKQDNSYHVITVKEKLNKISLHDLTITGGGSESASGSDRDGAGLQITNSSILVVNCIFRDNYADRDGGGVYINVNNANRSNEQVFIGCVFHHNFSWECGSAIFGANYADVKLIGSTVAANSSYWDGANKGGAVHLYDSDTKLKVASSVIAKNQHKRTQDASVAGASVTAHTMNWLSNSTNVRVSDSHFDSNLTTHFSSPVRSVFGSNAQLLIDHQSKSLSQIDYLDYQLTLLSPGVDKGDRRADIAYASRVSNRSLELFPKVVGSTRFNMGAFPDFTFPIIDGDDINLGPQSVMVGAAKLWISDRSEMRIAVTISSSNSDIIEVERTNSHYLLNYNNPGKTVIRGTTNASYNRYALEKEQMISVLPPAPIITSGFPEILRIEIGERIDLKVDVEPKEGANFTYQWYKGSASYGVPIPGATEPTYSTVLTEIGTSYQAYYLVITNTVNGQSSSTSSYTHYVDVKHPYLSVRKQPESVELYFDVNGSTSLEVETSVYNNSVLSYQWYSNSPNSNSSGVVIPGATNANYQAPLSQLGRIYYYVSITRVKDGIYSSTVKSNVVNVDVIVPPPTIVVEPQDHSMEVYENYTLQVEVDHVPGSELSYQWYIAPYNSYSAYSLIEGETGASFVPSINIANPYYFFVKVTRIIDGESASTNSRIATVNATPLLSIIKEPEDLEVTWGEVATLEVTVSPDNESQLAYQWYKSTTSANYGGTAIVGATNRIFNFTSNDQSGPFYYYVEVVRTVNDRIIKVVSRSAKVDLLISLKPSVENIIYVDKNVKNGTQSGNSWENAVRELADALQWAQANRGEGLWNAANPLKIYVAIGTYLPKYKLADFENSGIVTTSRDKSFLMVPNVQIFGGFDPDKGIKDLTHERVILNAAEGTSENGTILSGDFNDDDIVTGSEGTLNIVNNTENAYHVVVSAGAVGNALLDGVSVVGGNANIENSGIRVNGLHITRGEGGGMHNKESAPSSKNVIFRNSTAVSGGGGIANIADVTLDITSSPSFTNVAIIDNVENNLSDITNGGGGMYNLGSSPFLKNVTISGNLASSFGGGLHNSSSNPVLTNVKVIGNGANNGGGIFNVNASPILMNVTISGNWGDGLFSTDSSPRIYNSIIYGNENDSDVRNYNFDENIDPLEFYSSMVGGRSNWSTYWGDDKGDNIVTTINPFSDSANGDYSLSSNSEAINAGNNSYYTDKGRGDLVIDLDLAGNPRLSDAVIDLGAYEYHKKGPIDLTFDDLEVEKTKSYDGLTAVEVTGGNLMGVLDGHDVMVTPTAFYEDKDAGTNKIITVQFVLSGTDAKSYNAPPNAQFSDGEITSKQLDITAPTLIKSKTYDGTVTALVTGGRLIGVEAGDDVGVSATATYGSKGIGIDKAITVVYTLSGTAADNYFVPVTDDFADGEITAKRLTISTPTLTKRKTYDGDVTAAVTEGSVIGVEDGDDVMVSATAIYNNKDIGTGKEIIVGYTLTGAGAVAENYLAPVDEKFVGGEITAKQLIVASPILTKSKVYDATLAAKVDAGNLIGVEMGEEVGFVATAAYDNKDVGADKKIIVSYELTGEDMSNYLAPVNEEFTDAEITVKQLIISSPTLTKSKDYDATLSAAVIAGSLNGIETGENVEVSATAAYDNKDAGKSKAITVSYVLTGDDASNYHAPVDQVYNDGEIKQTTLQVIAKGKTKGYGQLDPSFEVEYSDFINGEDESELTGNLSNSREVGEVIGEYKITPSGLTATNYAIEYVDGKLTIIPLSVTVTADAKTKVYGEADPDLTFVSLPAVGTSLPNGELISFTGGLVRDLGEGVGIYAIDQGALANLNYTIAFTGADLEIKEATMTGLSLADKTVTYDGASHGLFVNGVPDDASVTYLNNDQTEAGDYTVKARVSKANYQDWEESAILTINKAESVITADAVQSHVYDGTVKNVAATLNHEESELAYSPQKGYTDVGTYLVTVSAAGSDNYNTVSKDVTLAITPAVMTGLNLTGKTVTYDGEIHSLSVSGLPDGATVTFQNNDQTEAGDYTVTARVSKANYQDWEESAILTINKAESVITADAVQSHVYDGTVKNVAATLNHVESELAYSPQKGYTDVGTYLITVSAAESDNYKAVSQDVTLEITPAVMTGLIFNDKTVTYNSKPQALVLEGAPTGSTIEYADNDQTDAGRYTVTAKVTHPNYKELTKSATLTISKAQQKITFEEVGTVTRDANRISLKASSSSGLSITITSDDQLVATIAGNDLLIHRLGTVRLTATQEGDKNHEAATPVTIIVQVAHEADGPVKVHKAVSPNGDGINDFLIIEGIKDYPENRLQVMTRTGLMVFDMEGYDNDGKVFRGVSNTRVSSETLPEGTYFYVLKYRDGGKWRDKKGWFVLKL